MILGRTVAPFERVHPAWLVLSSVSAQITVFNLAGCCPTITRPGWSFSVSALRISCSCIMYIVRICTVRWLLAYFLYMLVHLQPSWWPCVLSQACSLSLANVRVIVCCQSVQLCTILHLYVSTGITPYSSNILQYMMHQFPCVFTNA